MKTHPALAAVLMMAASLVFSSAADAQQRYGSARQAHAAVSRIAQAWYDGSRGADLMTPDLAAIVDGAWDGLSPSIDALGSPLDISDEGQEDGVYSVLVIYDCGAARFRVAFDGGTNPSYLRFVVTSTGMPGGQYLPERNRCGRNGHVWGG